MNGTLLLIVRAALTLSLYAFLGLALFTLWQNLRQQQKQLEARPLPELGLQIQMGEITQNRRFRGSEITLGRDPANGCALPSETVSARHARLSFHHGQWWLDDLQSTNGTFLNGERVSTSVVLAPGDEIRCGEALLRLPEE